MATINDLSDDVIVDIFQYLPLSSLFAVRMVCQRWRSAGKNPRLWRSVRLQGKMVDRFLDAAHVKYRRFIINSLQERAPRTIDTRNSPQFLWTTAYCNHYRTLLDSCPSMKRIHLGVDSTAKHGIALPTYIKALYFHYRFYGTQDEDHVQLFSRMVVSNLNELTSLRVLDVSFTGGEVEQMLSSIPKTVEWLNLHCIPINNDGMKIVGDLPRLRTLRASCNGELRSLDGLLSTLSRHNTIEVLNLAGCTNLTTLDNEDLSLLKNLHSLNLSGMSLPVARLGCNYYPISLQKLNISCNRLVSDKIFDHLERLTNLTVLKVKFCQKISIDGHVYGLKTLGSLRNLENPMFGGNFATDW